METNQADPNVETTEMPPLRLACLQVVGRRSELSHRVPVAWVALLEHAASVPDRPDPDRFYGVFLEREFAAAGADGTHRYSVGFELPAAAAAPDGLTVVEVAGGTFAKATVRGAADRIEATYRDLHAWLEDRELRLAPERHGFECYDRRRQSPQPPYRTFDYDVFRAIEPA